MKLEVILSTMNKKNVRFLDEMNIKNNCIVINQTNEEIQNIYLEEENIYMYNYNEKGLSRSRNRAINKSKADICLIADDDLIYVDNYSELIKSRFRKDDDILVFVIEGINKKFKEYYSEEKKLNYITSLKVSSVQIAFKLKSIIDNGIRFNESLGAGAKYSMGEENEFLYKCLNKKLKIRFIPIKIADLYIGDSSWFKGYNEKYFFDRGAVFYAMSKKYNILLILQFILRHKEIYKGDIGRGSALKYMLKGRKSYKEGCY